MPYQATVALTLREVSPSLSAIRFEFAEQDADRRIFTCLLLQRARSRNAARRRA
jgi:hypothetical protein